MFNNLSDKVSEFVIKVLVFDEIFPLVVLSPILFGTEFAPQVV